MRRSTIPNPTGVRNPRFSLSAICHIWDSSGQSDAAGGGRFTRAGTHLSEDSRVESGLVEECNGSITGDDAEVFGVGLLEEIAIDSLLLGRQVQVGRCCARGVDCQRIMSQRRRGGHSGGVYQNQRRFLRTWRRDADGATAGPQGFSTGCRCAWVGWARDARRRCSAAEAGGASLVGGGAAATLARQGKMRPYAYAVSRPSRSATRWRWKPRRVGR